MGAQNDTERLAVMLACSTKYNPMPTTQREMYKHWSKLTEDKRAGYRRRAKRLVRTWQS